MSDASCRLLTVLFDILDEENIPHEVLVIGTGLDLDTVKNESNWIAWNDLRAVLERASEIVGGNDQLMERTGRLLFQSSGNATLTAICQLLSGPKALYTAMARWISRQLFSMIDWRYEDVGPGHVRMHLAWDASYERMPQLPYMVGASMGGLPKILGYPGAVVDWEETDTSLVFDLQVAESQSLLARIARFLKAPLSARAIVREKEEQARALELRLVELRDAEHRAQAASRLKSRFLSTITHDLRTPLNGVLGTAELLLDDGTLPADIREMAKINQASARRLGTLIERMLEFNHDSGLAEIGTFSVAEVVEREAVALSDVAAAAATQVVVEVGARADVLGSPSRLARTMQALLDNAIRHAPGGLVRVVVEPPSDGDLWRFAVLDDGEGMTAATRKRLFQPLTQGDGGLTRTDGGVGLGVSMARKQVEAAGGAISVQSVLGVGTDFRFTMKLPVRAASEPQDAVRPRLRAAVAVVCAEEASRHAVATVVRAAGIQPRRITGDPDVLSRFAAENPTGVVLVETAAQASRVRFRWRELQVVELPPVLTVASLVAACDASLQGLGVRKE
jgi:signal transduction histidine kinase